jgi:hypothetical protein
MKVGNQGVLDLHHCEHLQASLDEVVWDWGCYRTVPYLKLLELWKRHISLLFHREQ